MAERHFRKVYTGEYATHFAGEAANEYLGTYSPGSVNARLHTIQAELVRKIISRYSKKNSPDQIDFACGFGLWLSALSDCTSSKIAIDINQSMLDLIPKNLDVIKFHSEKDNLDLIRFLNSEMRMITCFRFLLNSSQQGKLELIKIMKRFMRPSSHDVAIINVHGSSPSIRSLSKNVRNGGKKMSRKQVKNFFESFGFSIIEVQEMQLFPYGILSRFPALFYLESLFARVKYLGIGIDKIYVLKRKL